MATFFTYKGRKDQYGFESTEHSGCPIFEGEKWIATAWLREGVSLQEPFDNYDPSGVQLNDDEEYDETPQVRSTKSVKEEEESVILEEKDHDEL